MSGAVNVMVRGVPLRIEYAGDYTTESIDGFDIAIYARDSALRPQWGDSRVDLYDILATDVLSNCLILDAVEADACQLAEHLRATRGRAV